MTLAAVEQLTRGPCTGTIAAVLDAQAIDPLTVTSIRIGPRISGSDDSEVLQGYDAYVARGSQRLVVRVTPECRLLTVY